MKPLPFAVKLPSLLLLACALLPGVARAVDLTFGASIASGVATSDGTDLAPGSLVRIGTFGLTPAQIAAAANNQALLNLSFTEIGTAFIGDGNPSGAGSGLNSDPANAGLFTGSVPKVNTTASGLNVAGATLYYWVFNAATMGAATEQGVFGSTTWTIPSGTGTFGDIAMDTDIDFLTGGTTSLAGTALIPIGSFGPGTNLTAGGPDFSLAVIASAVPEPATTAVLAAVAVFAIACRHRRFRGRKRSAS